VLDKRTDKAHLLARVFKYDPWIVGLASKAVWGHNHGQVIHVHLRNDNIFRCSKDLEERKKPTKGNRWSSSTTENVQKLQRRVELVAQTRKPLASNAIH